MPDCNRNFRFFSNISTFFHIDNKVITDGVIGDKKYRIKETDTSEFWLPILKQKSFQDYVQTTYQIASGNIMQGDVDQAFEVETTNGVDDE